MRRIVATARPIMEDLAGTIAFYVLFLATGSAVVAALVGLGISVGQLIGFAVRREKPPALLLVGIVLTTVLGSATILMHDPRFAMLKPSIFYMALGCTMVRRGWLARYVPTEALQLLPARIFDQAGWMWAALMFATAVANLFFVSTLSPKMAATAFLLLTIGSKLMLFLLQYCTLKGRARAARDAVQP